MSETFTPPATVEECRARIHDLIEAETKLLLSAGSGEEYTKLLEERRTDIDAWRAEVDKLYAHGKATWPDDFDERIFARVTNPKDEHFDKIGQVGRWDHNCGDVHFPDGTVKSYSDWDLKKVTPAEARRQAAS